MAARGEGLSFLPDPRAATLERQHEKIDCIRTDRNSHDIGLQEH